MSIIGVVLRDSHGVAQVKVVTGEFDISPDEAGGWVGLGWRGWVKAVSANVLCWCR